MGCGPDACSSCINRRSPPCAAPPPAGGGFVCAAVPPWDNGGPGLLTMAPTSNQTYSSVALWDTFPETETRAFGSAPGRTLGKKWRRDMGRRRCKMSLREDSRHDGQRKVSFGCDTVNQQNQNEQPESHRLTTCPLDVVVSSSLFLDPLRKPPCSAGGD